MLRSHRISFYLFCCALVVCCFVALCLASAQGTSREQGTSNDVSGYRTKHVFIVVMDGVRYTETFGDDTHRLIPHLYNDLTPQGTLFTNCYNRGITITRQGHSTLISGTWQAIPNGGPRLTRPTLFEYYRNEKGVPATKCWSIFGKGPYAFAPYSSHPAYGSKYAGQHVNGGGRDNPLSEDTAEGNIAVRKKVVDVMRKDQPDIVFINFGYTDHIAHISDNINDYYAAIKNCDEQMWELWNAIQSDPHYRDTTTVFFANDHGRHINDFRNHGDHCEGCEHVMMLVLGPDIKKGAVVGKEVMQIDVAPTAAELVGFQTPLAAGSVLTDALSRYLGINKKEARTETARRAVQMEKLAERDLIKMAADYVVTSMRPEAIPADPGGAFLASGMVRAFGETNEQRHLEFVQKWIDAHETSGDVDEQIAVGNVILGLPAKTRQHYLALPNKLGEQAINGHIDSGVRNRVLRLGVFLGRLAEVTNKPDYGKAGLKILKAGLDQLSIKTSALEFSSLGEAAALFREDDTVMKLFVLAEARTLQNMQEDGALWQDSTLTVLNLYGLEAPKRRAALREFVKTAGPKPTLPPTVKLMTQEELRAIFPERPRAELLQLQIQLVNLIFDRGKQNIPFSLDMLRYGVNEAGAYANGSPVAQGGFLLSYKKLPWRYGGNTWPGSEEARKPR